jgi:Protein of unknown function (DUF2997)
MSMETLEFVIHPDGRVEERVSGIIGRSCAEVTAAIEAKLGRVVKTESSSEFFAQANALTESAYDSTTVSTFQDSAW